MLFMRDHDLGVVVPYSTIQTQRQDSQNSKQHHFKDQFLVFCETAPGDSESAQHTEGKISNIHF